MKNLLVPTDFSPEAGYAFETAVRLAQRTGGRVLLLHAIELPETAGFSTYGGPAGAGNSVDDTYIVQLLHATRQRLRQLVAQASEWAPEVPVYDLVQANSLSNSIEHVIAHQHIDLVVMGAHSHSAAEHFFLGSNTERLVRTAPCPVLAVKHPVGNFNVQTLVFPSDFAPEADHAVAELRSVQALFPQAKLHLLQVVPGGNHREAVLAKIEDFAQRHHLQHYEPVVLEAASPSTGIPQYAWQVNADLVVLPTHGRTGLGRLLHAHVAEEVATHAFPPVLTFRLGWQE